MSDKRATKKYTPIDRNIAVEVVRPPMPTDENLRIVPASQQRIIMPQTANENKAKHTAPVLRAVSCGPDCKKVKDGDLVLISIRAAGQALTVIHDGDELFLIDEAAVVGILTPEQADRVEKEMAECT